MSRSHSVLFASALVVGLGSSAALSGLLLQGGAKGIGPLPGSALSLPAETRFVAGVEVKKLVQSPLYSRYPAMAPAAFSEIKARTGLDPAKDLDRIVLANTSDRPQTGVIFVYGTINLPGLRQAVQAPDHKGVQEKKVGGETLFSYEDKNGTSVSVVLLDEHSLLVGTGPAVDQVLANLSSGKTPLRENKGLVERISKLRQGATFWMAGDQSVLQALPRTLPGSDASGGQALNLPALTGLSLVADLSPAIVLDLQGETKSPTEAKQLADVVRGFVALASMQAAQKPELQGLASAVNVTNEENRVLLNARVPYEVLDSLQGHHAPGGGKDAPAPGH
jgi:hypothetical protein